MFAYLISILLSVALVFMAYNLLWSCSLSNGFSDTIFFSLVWMVMFLLNGWWERIDYHNVELFKTFTVSFVFLWEIDFPRYSVFLGPGAIVGALRSWMF